MAGTYAILGRMRTNANKKIKARLIRARLAGSGAGLGSGPELEGMGEALKMLKVLKPATN